MYQTRGYNDDEEEDKGGYSEEELVRRVQYYHAYDEYLKMFDDYDRYFYEFHCSKLVRYVSLDVFRRYILYKEQVKDMDKVLGKYLKMEKLMQHFEIVMEKILVKKNIFILY